MSERVLMGAGDQSKRDRAAVAPWTSDRVARIALWIGLVLTLAALSDYAMALYPSGFGSPEWEMATISQLVAGLPLVSIGLVGVWIGGGWLGHRWLLVVVGLMFLVGAVCVFGSLLLFATNIPTALRATQDVSRIGIQKLVGKTMILGVLFGVTYIVTGILALKQARASSSTEAIA